MDMLNIIQNEWNNSIYPSPRKLLAEHQNEWYLVSDDSKPMIKLINKKGQSFAISRKNCLPLQSAEHKFHNKLTQIQSPQRTEQVDILSSKSSTSRSSKVSPLPPAGRVFAEYTAPRDSILVDIIPGGPFVTMNSSMSQPIIKQYTTNEILNTQQKTREILDGEVTVITTQASLGSSYQGSGTMHQAFCNENEVCLTPNSLLNIGQETQKNKFNIDRSLYYSCLKQPVMISCDGGGDLGIFVAEHIIPKVNDFI